MPRLIDQPQDRQELRDALRQRIDREDDVRLVMVNAGLEPSSIALPSGFTEGQWDAVLRHADRHGEAALARLLGCAAKRSPALLDEIGDLLRRYGVDVSALRQGTIPPGPLRSGSE